jgi:membrane-associated HD superfamily phosphohydrolase
MITGLQHLHNSLRWVVLVLLIVTLIDSLIRMYKPFNENDRKLALFTLIAVHIQLLTGLVLYFLRAGYWYDYSNGLIMKNPVTRFWLVEHLLGMVIAVALITVGYSRAKRQSEKWAKHRMIFFYYLVGFILIIASIPWPFRLDGIAKPWF